jgi:glycosyltransferase involved in cell wall biosynthesis
MKTILIAHNYNETSYSAMSYHLAHHLADLGHKVVFISHKPYFPEKKTVKTEKGEIFLYSWPSEKRPTSITDYIWFAKIYRQYTPDVIVGHFVGSNICILVSKLMSFGKVKTIEYYHTLTQATLTDIGKIPLKINLLLFRKKIFYRIFCDVIVCPSKLGKEALESFFGAKNGIVLLNSITDRFKLKKHISSDSIIVSFLGGLNPTKGIVELVTAYIKYKNENQNSKIILNIAGTGTQALEIIKLIQNVDGINYLGAISYDKVDDYLNKSDFTIIPSKFDNLPTVGLESLMNQTPLLISNNTGLTNYLVDGKDCFKFDPTVDSILSLFEKIETKSYSFEQMRKEARITYLDKFSIKSYCDNFTATLL